MSDINVEIEKEKEIHIVLDSSVIETDPIFTNSPAFNVVDSGDGTQYLSDDGTYKPVDVKSSFIDLTDTPNEYEDKKDNLIKVNSTEDGLEFVKDFSFDVLEFRNRTDLTPEENNVNMYLSNGVLKIKDDGGNEIIVATI